MTLYERDVKLIWWQCQSWGLKEVKSTNSRWIILSSDTCLRWCPTQTEDFTFVTFLKEQCVAFQGIYWQKWNKLLISMISLVYDHLKLRIVFVSLELALHIYTGSGSSSRHVAPPCFYSSSEQTNQTLAPERAFHVFTLPEGPRSSPTRLEWEGWVEGFSVGCNLQPHRKMPLNPTHWSFKILESWHLHIAFMGKMCFFWFS